MMNKKSFEYIVKAKNTKIEYEINRKFDFKIFIEPIILLLIVFIIFFIFKPSLINDIINDNNIIFDDEFKLLMFQYIGMLIVMCLVIIFLMVINDMILGLRKIKLENNIIFIIKRNKEYILNYEDLIKIRVGKIGTSSNLFSEYGLYIYYLENYEIKELMVSFPKRNLNKIREICSIFITNNNIEKLNESEYYDVRTKEKDEIINKVLNDEIIW